MVEEVKGAVAVASAPQSSVHVSVLKCFQKEPDRSYTAEDLAKALKLLSPKDPQKQSQTICEIASCLKALVQEGQIREIAPSSFKKRRFFDKENNIEHAFIGGMGNSRYGFVSSIFRLNIGVLSLYFTQDVCKQEWRVKVKDTTIGKDYCLIPRLQGGVYHIGSAQAESGERNYFRIEGKYIAKRHMAIAISGIEINIVDNNTLYGTRIDHFTDEGLLNYQKLARTFLEQETEQGKMDPVRQGRFLLEQLIHRHLNFEAVFFGTVVDSLLLNEY